MKTTTATKTAVAWMLIGGVAALAASMALGLPWQNNNSVLSPIITNQNNTGGAIKNLKYRWECKDGNGKIVKVWQIGENATEELISQTNSDAINGCKGIEGKILYASHTKESVDISKLKKARAADLCWQTNDGKFLDCPGLKPGDGCQTSEGNGGVCRRISGTNYCNCVTRYDKTGGIAN